MGGGRMTGHRARAIVADFLYGESSDLNWSNGDRGDYVRWDSEEGGPVKLDGRFSAEELEALAWWIRNRSTEAIEAEKRVRYQCVLCGYVGGGAGGMVESHECDSPLGRWAADYARRVFGE